MFCDHGLGSRVSICAGDFFTDPLPSVEVCVFGHVLHDGGMNAKRTVLQKTYDTLPKRGAVIDDEIVGPESMVVGFK
jgi:hypothetical protein